MSILFIFFILLLHRRISPVNDYIGVERTFKITINQTVDVSWQINVTEVQTNASVYDVSFKDGCRITLLRFKISSYFSYLTQGK